MASRSASVSEDATAGAVVVSVSVASVVVLSVIGGFLSCANVAGCVGTDRFGWGHDCVPVASAVTVPRFSVMVSASPGAACAASSSTCPSAVWTTA